MKTVTTTWVEIAPDHWEASMSDGQWTILRDGFELVALPPNGRSYPYSLAAGLFRFGTLERVQLAAQEASLYQFETLGSYELSKVRKRIDQAGKIGLHRQFAVTSCGVNFAFCQAVPEAEWGIIWEGHGHSGALASPSVTELFNQIRTVFVPNRKVRVWPEGMRAAFLAENQRAMNRANLVETLTTPSQDEQSVTFDLRQILSNSALKDLRKQDAAQTGSFPIPSKTTVAA